MTVMICLFQEVYNTIHLVLLLFIRQGTRVRNPTIPCEAWDARAWGEERTSQIVGVSRVRYVTSAADKITY
jgi:hypothetical protein